MMGGDACVALVPYWEKSPANTSASFISFSESTSQYSRFRYPHIDSETHIDVFQTQRPDARGIHSSRLRQWQRMPSSNNRFMPCALLIKTSSSLSFCSASVRQRTPSGAFSSKPETSVWISAIENPAC